MRATRKTHLAGSEPQDIYFENLDNDARKELVMNDWWKHVTERSRVEMLGEIDRSRASCTTRASGS